MGACSCLLLVLLLLLLCCGLRFALDGLFASVPHSAALPKPAGSRKSFAAFTTDSNLLNDPPACTQLCILPSSSDLPNKSFDVIPASACFFAHHLDLVLVMQAFDFLLIAFNHVFEFWNCWEFTAGHVFAFIAFGSGLHVVLNHPSLPPSIFVHKCRRCLHTGFQVAATARKVFPFLAFFDEFQNLN